MWESLMTYCRRTGREELLAQWHPARNLPLTPQAVARGSSRRVWWQCPKGHAWQADVFSRVSRGAGCPYCAGRRPAAGESDLAVRYPALAAQWHPEKNGDLTPQQVTPGSHRKVWWRCERGHEWRAMVKSRAAGTGCPVCAGRAVCPGENDLATRYPALAAQWHPTKNGALTPAQVSPCSNRRVWWVCQRGHAYPAVVAARTRAGSGCPYCAGRKVLPGFNDLGTLAPRVAAQWHPTLNGALTPADVTAGSRKKVWWRCDEGHVWQAAIYSRTGGRQCGCPVCAGTVSRRRRRAPPDSLAASGRAIR